MPEDCEKCGLVELTGYVVVSMVLNVLVHSDRE